MNPDDRDQHLVAAVDHIREAMDHVLALPGWHDHCLEALHRQSEYLERLIARNEVRRHRGQVR